MWRPETGFDIRELVVYGRDHLVCLLIPIGTISKTLLIIHKEAA